MLVLALTEYVVTVNQAKQEPSWVMCPWKLTLNSAFAEI